VHRRREHADAVPGVRGPVQIEVWRAHACARYYDGAVACWGGNPSAVAGVGRSAASELHPHTLVVCATSWAPRSSCGRRAASASGARQSPMPTPNSCCPPGHALLRGEERRR